MRDSTNRQTVSTTARWNMAQSDPNSPGAQKRPLKNQQTGQGSNLKQLQHRLASAEIALSETTDPRLIQNIAHGITLLKAQIARISGVDTSGFDVNTVPDSITGYQFAGAIEATDFESVAVMNDPVDQSPISPFAAFQLFGTLRQKITKVGPPQNATPAGSLQHPGINPRKRSTVIKNVDNPDGSGFDYGNPALVTQGFYPQADTRDNDYSGTNYRQDDKSLHLNVYSGRGVTTSTQVARGKHGQYLGGYSYSE